MEKTRGKKKKKKKGSKRVLLAGPLIFLILKFEVFLSRKEFLAGKKGGLS